MHAPPTVGSTWDHVNGNVYEVLLLANLNTERPRQYPVTVVYRNTANGTVWSRPLSDWHRSMRPLEANTKCPSTKA